MCLLHRVYYQVVFCFLFFPPLLPGVKVKCKVLQVLGERETRGMSVSSFKLLSSFLHSISLFLSTGLCQLWKLKKNPFPEGQYCLSWSFKQIFYTSLSWVIRMGEDSMGERRRKVYILEQEIKIELTRKCLISAPISQTLIYFIITSYYVLNLECTVRYLRVNLQLFLSTLAGEVGSAFLLSL